MRVRQLVNKRNRFIESIIHRTDFCTTGRLIEGLTGQVWLGLNLNMNITHVHYLLGTRKYECLEDSGDELIQVLAF